MADSALVGDLVAVPAGTARIGLTKDEVMRFRSAVGFIPSAEMFVDQTPDHEVAVAAFRLAKSPLTNRAFAAFVSGGGYRDLALFREMVKELGPRARSMIEELFVDAQGKPGPSTWSNGQPPSGKDDHPVEGISAYEAMAAARFFGGRLPTEAEWEYAARYPDHRLLPGGKPNPQDPIANVKELKLGGTSSVGSFPASTSELGLVDLMGNVYEWTASRYAAYPGGVERQHFAPTPDDRVLRGGAYRDSVFAALCTTRFVQSSLRRFVGLGARVAFAA